MDVLRTEMCTAFDVGTSRWKSLSRKRDPSYIRTDKLDARRNSDSRPPLHLLERFKRIESENRGVARNLETNLDQKPPPPLPCPLEIPFETFDQLSRPTSPPRLGSSIDHPPPPSPKYRSLVDATTLSIFQATPFTDHHFHYLVEIVRILSSGF